MPGTGRTKEREARLELPVGEGCKKRSVGRHISCWLVETGIQFNSLQFNSFIHSVNLVQCSSVSSGINGYPQHSAGVFFTSLSSGTVVYYYGEVNVKTSGERGTKERRGGVKDSQRDRERGGDK